MVTPVPGSIDDPRVARAWQVIAEVPDPEIPAISVVDLGVIRSVTLEGGRLRVEVLPTFVGCPAIDVMRQQIDERLRAESLAPEIDVVVSFAEPWTSERISDLGREQLRASGFAPPDTSPHLGALDELSVLPIATCPYCGGRNTALENPFGPTLCRAIYHCADCRQPFEQMKRV